MSAEQLFMVGNFVRPTTAAPAKQATGTAVRTMLQLATTSGAGIYIVEWGISFDGSAAGTPIQCELFATTVAATAMTALAAADVMAFSDPGGAAADQLQFGTGLTAYAPGAAVTEGTVANYRGFDEQMIQPSGQYVKQWPLGREPQVLLSQFLRVRVTAPASVNCTTYVIFGG
jgi:hypothetical protein